MLVQVIARSRPPLLSDALITFDIIVDLWANAAQWFTAYHKYLTSCNCNCSPKLVLSCLSSDN